MAIPHYCIATDIPCRSEKQAEKAQVWKWPKRWLERIVVTRHVDCFPCCYWTESQELEWWRHYDTQTLRTLECQSFITVLPKEFSSVQFSPSFVSYSLQPHESQHARPPCPSPTLGVYSNSCLSTQWCHPTISSSVIPFSSCPQSFPASGSFPMSQLFTWVGQSIEVSASASFLPMNTLDWSPLGWTGWISLQSKGLSRVNTTVQKHQFFGTQLSSQSNSHIHTWLLEKP